MASWESQAKESEICYLIFKSFLELIKSFNSCIMICLSISHKKNSDIFIFSLNLSEIDDIEGCFKSSSSTSLYLRDFFLKSSLVNILDQLGTWVERNDIEILKDPSIFVHFSNQDCSLFDGFNRGTTHRPTFVDAQK